MIRAVQALFALVLFALLSACVSLAPSASAPGLRASLAPTDVLARPTPGLPHPPSGWFAMWDDGVAFAQITIQAPAVAGTIGWLYVEGPVDHYPKTVASTVSGTLSSGSLTAHLDTSPWGPATWSGQLTGDRLTLSYLSSDGQIGVFDFTPATANDYNRAAEDFRDLQAQLAEQEASAQASAQAVFTSCSSQVVDHDALLVVSGAPGAVAQCLQIVFSISPRGGTWQQVSYPAVSPFGRITCSGRVGAHLVEMYDTGGAVYAMDVCRKLGLL